MNWMNPTITWNDIEKHYSHIENDGINKRLLAVCEYETYQGSINRVRVDLDRWCTIGTSMSKTYSYVRLETLDGVTLGVWEDGSRIA